MTRLTACLLAAALAAPASADNWPQWRGPKNDGHSAEKGLPAEFGPDKNLVWKFKLPGGDAGRGASTPCVWGDRLFLTAMDGSSVVLLCVGTDGAEKWRRPMGAGRPGYKPDRKMGREGDDADPSPSTDGKHVWAFSGNGKLVCYDFDGNLAWEKDVQDYGKFSIQFGIHWTPVLYKGRLYLQVFHRGTLKQGAQLLLALDAATGKDVWAVHRPGAGKGESPDTYASAFVWEGEGGPLLIAHGNDFCTAHKLEDGAEVWRVVGLNPGNSGAWRFVASPLVTPDLIVVPTCKNSVVVGLNPVGAKGAIDQDNPAELWRITGTPDVVSPLRVGDLVYLMHDGPLAALEAKTGKLVKRVNLSPGIHRANMVAADGKIYVVGVDGSIDVVEPGPELKVLAKNKLPDTIYASPAVSGGRVYFRGWDHLWAVGTK